MGSQIRIVSLLFILFLSSCTNRNRVLVEKYNFSDEILQEQNLVFTFNQSLVPDSIVEKWDTIAYINFEPKIPGKFKWNNDHELTFSPSNPFDASTLYKANLTDHIVRFKNGLNVDTKKIIEFHTPYLKLLSADTYWALDETDQYMATLQVTLNFNYTVDPTVLSSLLSMTIGANKTAYSQVSTEAGQTLTYKIKGFNKDNLKQEQLSIQIESGLKCVESNYKSTAVQSLDIKVYPPTNLEIIRAEAEYIGSDALIHVYTSQSVSEKSIESFVKIDNKSDFIINNMPGGFYLKSKFKSGLSYQLDIKAGMTGELGGNLNDDFSQLIQFGEPIPDLRFVSSSGIYLSNKSAGNIAMSIVNIPKVQVSIRKIYDNNIIHFFRQNRYRTYEDYSYEGGDEQSGYDGNSGDYVYNSYNSELYGDLIFQQDYDVKDLARVNGATLINVGKLNQGEYKGIYLIEVNSSSDLYKRATKLFSFSDIGLIARKNENEIYVFANSIKSAQSISGATVSLISTNNQIIATQKTNSDGVAVFSGLNPKARSFSSGMITVKNGDDFNFLNLEDSRINTSRYDVGGRRINSSGYMAFFYGDRNIYRPGENINFNTIVVNEKWEPASNIPIKVKLISPNGREFKALRGTLNNQGAFSSSFSIPQSVITGTYSAEVYSGNDVLLQSKSISVEEFMPDRIDVKLVSDKEIYNLNDTVVVDAIAVNLFGPPAAERNYDVEFTLARSNFTAKGFEDFDFSLITKDERLPSEVRQGKTDKSGMLLEKFYLSPVYSGSGKLRGKAFVTVFDETGRPVNRVKQFDVFTQDVFYGIKMREDYLNSLQPVSIPLVALSKSGQQLESIPAHVQVVRSEWYSVMEKDEYGSVKYVSKKNERIIVDKEITLGKNAQPFSFIPRESGDFEVRVMKPGSDKYVSAAFYAYKQGFTASSAFKVNTEGQVEIKFDKEIYNIGDKANVLFTTPFAGRLLVTVECDNVMEYHYLNTDKKAAKLSLPVKESYLPNVYITATVFRPLDDGAIPVTVGHGFAPMIVNVEKNKLPVTISAVEQSRSKTKQTITVKTRPMKDVELTIAVVDEGILQLKNFKTPDPYNFFYQKKALAVNAFDLYPSLLPDIQLRRSSSGGDGYDLDKRVNPMTNKRVKLVSFWSGILKTDASGFAKYTIDIPQFSGDLRIMACAYKDKAYGSFEKHMKVADPIVINSGIPRFVSPKDTILMPVTLSNTTDKVISGSAVVNTTGGLIISGNSTQSISIPPRSERKVNYKIVVSPVIGTATINVVVNASGEKFTDNTDITIRPPSSLVKLSDVGAIENATSKSVYLDNDFIPRSVSTKLVVSKSPIVQFSDKLYDLLGYPYGCLEQTVSKSFPQLYYGELISTIKNPVAGSVSPTYMVQEGIRKIEMMQSYNGGFTYWMGGNDVNWWASAYATHFLIETSKAGFEVNSSILDRSLQYLNSQVRVHETFNYTYWDAQKIKRTKKMAKRENAYSLFVIARAGKADISLMNYYRTNPDLLTTESQYLLAAAYLAAGDRKGYEQLLPKSYSSLNGEEETGGSFSSFIRDQALSLNAIIDYDPSNPQIGSMVKQLSSQMKKEQYLNTQELSFSLMAIGKFLKKQNNSTITAKVYADEKLVGSFTNSDLVIDKDIKNKKMRIVTEGSGTVYYFYQQEGISTSGKIKEEDSYLRVRKTFYTRFGQPLSVNQLKQGEMIVVKLSVSTIDKSSMNNIVVTDLLPAGFEIENPRISELKELDWAKDESTPDNFDVRDDRISFFTSVDGNNRNFYYLVRAVSPGNYVLGPVSADAMYNGEYHSYSGSGRVRIVQ